MSTVVAGSSACSAIEADAEPLSVRPAHGLGGDGIILGCRGEPAVVPLAGQAEGALIDQVDVVLVRGSAMPP